jgi:hypothetical protein
MSLGATMSAPAAACDKAARERSFESRRVDFTVTQHTAVAVTGVLAHADVGDDHQIRKLLLERLHSSMQRRFRPTRTIPSRPWSLARRKSHSAYFGLRGSLGVAQDPSIDV